MTEKLFEFGSNSLPVFLAKTYTTNIKNHTVLMRALGRRKSPGLI